MSHCIFYLFFVPLFLGSCFSQRGDSYNYPSYDSPQILYDPTNDDIYDPSDPEPQLPFSGELEEPTFEEKLQAHRENLTSLFASPDEAKEKVYDRVLRGTDYWQLDAAYYEIETKLGNNNDVSPSVRESANAVLDLIRGQMNEASELPGYNEEFFQRLNESRNVFDCALGRVATDDHYSQVEGTCWLSTWLCEDSIPAFWWDLVNVNYNGKSCSLDKVILNLLRVKAAAYAKCKNSRIQDASQLQIDFLLTLSKPSHLSYLTPFLCNSSTSARGCALYERVICDDLTYSLVSEITGIIESGTTQHIPTSSSDLAALVNVQTSLGLITNQLTSKSLKANLLNVDAANQMLESYLGIFDTAFGSSSVPVWQQTSRSTTQSQFQNILLSNEEYVGYASEVILTGSNSLELNKTALSVQMQRIRLNHGDRATAQFVFGDAQIWTDALEEANLNSSDYNVYALYYNSWHELLQNIGGREGRDSDLGVGVTPRGATSKRFFVGKGGIVSLSTISDRLKRSVPVTYRMKFDSDATFVHANGSVNRRCLSCGFLDVNSGDWGTGGCYAASVDESGVTCKCNHTTNFAAFMSPFEAEFIMTETQAVWLDIIQYVGSVTSVIGLIVSFVIFCVVRHTVRNDRLRAHMNLSIALLFVHAIQLGADFAVYDDNLCIFTTIATHYFLLASFMWMFVEGVFLYLYVVQVFMHSRLENRRWMYLIGWLVPAIIVAVSAGYGLPNDVYVQETKPFCDEGQILYPSYGDTTTKFAVCWLSASSGMTWAFIAPALAVILFNLFILCKVVQVLVKLSERSKGMKPFQAPNRQGHRNYGYQTKPRASLQFSKVKPPSSADKTIVDDSITSSTQESSFQNDSLHGNVITHSGSYSASRSNSQSLQQHALVRPRTATAPSSDNNFLKDVKTAVKGAMVLLPILGIPWICGMLGYKSYALQVVFVLLNSVQGVMIFLVYCVFNGEVFRALQRQLQLYRMNRFNDGRGRASSTSSFRSVMNKGILRNWRRRSTAISTLSGSNQQV